MDPRALLEPVGPLPPRVYWVRRGALLAALVLLVVVIAVSCSGGSSRRAAQTVKPVATSTPATTPSATPTSSASLSPAIPHCGRADITVTVSTDAPSYPPGVIPQLQVSIRNSSARTCYLTESPSRRTWTIVSGSDTVWTTAGCQRSSAAVRTTLSPGESVRHTLAWNRHRSGPQCTTTSTEAPPGTYQLSTVVSGVHSDKAVFRLTK
jgi:hypothetical protein